jgi:hypothetical protein
LGLGAEACHTPYTSPYLVRGGEDSSLEMRLGNPMRDRATDRRAVARIVFPDDADRRRD